LGGAHTRAFTPPQESCLRDRIPFIAEPMLATLVAKPFDEPGWIYEEKYDGYRILAYKEAEKVKLVSRNDKDRTADYPEIARAVARLSARTLLLDGEVVVFDAHKVSRFQLLQRGGAKAKYSVFDCLYRDGKDLRSQPLSNRRAALEEVVGRKGSVIFLSRRLAENGLEAYRDAKKRGFEGLVAKDMASPYVAGRSRSWRKVKVHQEDEFVIVGFTPPKGSRQHLGALLLGAHEKGKLQYVGKVGTGFTNKTLASLWKVLRPLVTEKKAVADPPGYRNAVYVRPELVAQISYQEWTADQKLRQPVFLGLRDDKDVREVTMPLQRA
jgi:bifunctional non-homologous end joining protein LigD